MSEFPEARRTSDAVEPSGRDTVVPPEARQEIEGTLSAFRQWLLDSEEWRHAIAAPPEEEADSAVDLHTLLSEWIALKQEVRLEARGSKATREELNRAVEAFHESVDRVQQDVQKQIDPLVRERDRMRDDLLAKLESQERVWVELVLDLREALSRGAETSRQVNNRLGWRRWFLPGELFGSLLEGYELGLRRVDAALKGRGIHRIDCEGQRVDPERMRVVDVVRRGDIPEGHVAEVVRDGYTCGSRVVRYAEVCAVAGKSTNQLTIDD